MSTVETFERESYTFGTDAMVARLIELIATHENTHGDIVYYGNVDYRAVSVVRCAITGADVTPEMWSALTREFQCAGPFWLTAEPMAVLVESLVDYAMGHSPCGVVAHFGALADGSCDCERRELAREWVYVIASKNGIELTDKGQVRA